MSLFAESFQDMLHRDYADLIFRTLVEQRWVSTQQQQKGSLPAEEGRRVWVLALWTHMLQCGAPWAMAAEGPQGWPVEMSAGRCKVKGARYGCS